uniref:Uncharacterized protein n=1 Tax=Zea mays TaxID=4577 RepID=C4J5Q5_MAIZE|nr:unknown [Zea mays]
MTSSLVRLMLREEKAESTLSTTTMEPPRCATTMLVLASASTPSATATGDGGLERSRNRVTFQDSSWSPCARTWSPYRSAARGLAMAAVSSIRLDRSISTAPAVSSTGSRSTPRRASARPQCASAMGWLITRRTSAARTPGMASRQ